jgi:hypothetical protein
MQMNNEYVPEITRLEEQLQFYTDKKNSAMYVQWAHVGSMYVRDSLTYESHPTQELHMVK